MNTRSSTTRPHKRPNPVYVSLLPKWAREIHHCERGEMTVEYLLVMLGVVMPLFLAMPVAYFMLYAYFYRTVTIISMPVP